MRGQSRVIPVLQKTTWRLVARQRERATVSAHLWPALRSRPTNFIVSYQVFWKLDHSRASTGARPRHPLSGFCSPVNPICQILYLICLAPMAQQLHVPLHTAVIVPYALLFHLFKWSFSIKNIYLSRMSSVLSTDCTTVFYLTRQTKLDPTYIYFEDVYNRSNLCVNWASHLSKKLLWYICISCYDIYI